MSQVDHYTRRRIRKVSLAHLVVVQRNQDLVLVAGIHEKVFTYILGSHGPMSKPHSLALVGLWVSESHEYAICEIGTQGEIST